MTKPRYAVGLCAALALMLAACSNKRADIQLALSNADAREDKAEDVTIIYSKMGHVQARLYSKHFLRNESAKPPYVDMKGGLKVEFFDDSLHIKNTVTARNGRWYEAQNNVVLRDSVQVVNDKGERLNTQELVWNEQLRRFYSDKVVHITTPTQIITSQGLEANEDFSWYEMKQVIGSVLVDKSKMPE